MYLDLFTDEADVISQFSAPSDALANANVLLAWYEYESYSGSAMVIFEKDGKLWEVNGGHCSCNGLEGQWEPEETTWEALAMRDYSIYGGPKANEFMSKVIAEHAVTAKRDESCTKDGVGGY